MSELTRSRCLVLPGVPRARMDELSGRLFAAGALGLAEDWMPGAAPPPRQPWDPDGPDPEPDPVWVRAWFEDPNEAEIGDWARAFVSREARGSGGVRWEEVEDRDWEAESRASFPAVEVAPGWWIAPPWDPRPGALIIEPGTGFGTGHHASTRTALRLFLRGPGQQAGTALDVGCGSGILALAAARLGARVTGIDVEATAVRDAQHNAALNQLEVAFSGAPLHTLTGTFDLVFANLHAELLVALAPEICARTGRWLIVAGVLADREAQVHEAFAGALTCADRETEDEWVALTWERRG